MEVYNRISFFSTRARLRQLRTFRHEVEAYFADLKYGQFGGGPIEGDKARAMRPCINRKIARISSIAFYSCTPTAFQILRAPIAGGGTYSVDVLANLFSLGDHDLDKENVFDLIDRSIGIYEHDRIDAILRTINPLWWCWRLIVSLSSLPFKLIGRAGFNRDAAESSPLGRIFKLAIQFVLAAVATVAAVLEIDSRVNEGRIADRIQIGE